MGCCFSKAPPQQNFNAVAQPMMRGGGGATHFSASQPAAMPNRVFGQTPSGVWSKESCFGAIRQASGGSCYDQGNESEGKKEGKRGRPWQCPGYKWVNVWNNDIKLLSMRMAPATIYLDVSNNDIMTLTTMEGGQSLVYLDASSNNIGRGGTGGMPHFGTLMMPCLEGVNLANNDIGPEVPPGGMDWCPNARAVSMNNNDIEMFCDNPSWQQIQYLNLANNNLRVCPTLPRSLYLRQLYLESNKLGDDQIGNVCHLISIHPYLIKLKLGHNLFSAAGISQIVAHARSVNPYLFAIGDQTFEQVLQSPELAGIHHPTGNL